MNEKQVLNKLRNACTGVNSLRYWAANNGLSAAYVSDVLNGRRSIGPKILKALNVKVTKVYEDIK